MTRLLLSFSLTISILISACSTAPETGRKQLMLVPESQLSAMGAQAFNAMLQQKPAVENEEVVQYVKCVSEPIIRATAKRYEDAPENWKLAVIQDPTPNAFALPGGYVGVHVGLLKTAKTDAQLATVIGHEIGHVLADHSGERVSQQLVASGGMALVEGFLLGDVNPQERNLIMAALGAGAQVGVLLPYSRTQESEADVIGLQLMANAGFDPRQSVDLWRNMQQAGGDQPPQFLSTHPDPENRIQRLQEQMPKALSEYQSEQEEAGRLPASKCERPSEEVIESAMGAVSMRSSR